MRSFEHRQALHRELPLEELSGLRMQYRYAGQRLLVALPTNPFTTLWLKELLARPCESLLHSLSSLHYPRTLEMQLHRQTCTLSQILSLFLTFPFRKDAPRLALHTIYEECIHRGSGQSSVLRQAARGRTRLPATEPHDFSPGIKKEALSSGSTPTLYLRR